MFTAKKPTTQEQPKDRKGIADNISELARLCDKVRSTVQEWRRSDGFPPEVEGGGWSLFEVGQFIGRRDEARRWQALLPSEGDPLLASGDGSPGLERYREAKARLAEMDVEEREKSHAPIQTMRQGMMTIALCIRQGVEQLQREFGVEAYNIMTAALDEAVRQINQHFGPDDTQETEGADDGSEVHPSE